MSSAETDSGPADGQDLRAEAGPIAAGSGAREPRQRRGWALLILLAALATIVLPVRRPPILDLPMLLDQATSLSAVLAGTRTDQSIDWVGPNKLGVLLAWAVRGLTPEVWAPRLIAFAVASVWLLSFHLIAHRAHRPVAAAILVSPLLFGSAFYAGFFNFVAGVAALAFWVIELEPRRRTGPAWRIALSTLLGALLLYWAHVLWLFAVGFAVATCVLLHRFRWQEAAARLVSVLPVAWLGIEWSRGAKGSAWQTMILVMVEPLDRLRSLALSSSLALGGIRSPVESVVLVAVLGWILLGVVRAVRERGSTLHPFLGITALVLIGVAILAPDTVDKTMLFAWRWGGLALATAVLAVPPPELPAGRLLLFASFVAALHLSVTAASWRAWERDELAGFEDALGAIPPSARLVQLDVGDPVAEFRFQPVIHLYAYAASEHGAWIPFRFADLGNGLMRWVHNDQRRVSADFVLWQPGRLRSADLRQFTHVLVRSPGDELGRLAPWAEVLRLVRGSGRWGLFEVAAPAGAPARPTTNDDADASDPE
ncbi:MAG: hypothetical protein F9K16_03440 [Thermoanaerobaculia bacterium]|nr:MAG: hypothetical protein F9K16_03440 [Thermoanaerobaculia bacterium]MBZ0103904.1 hypothetical protein [Thermoanaerobaculia bacterium]